MIPNTFKIYTFKAYNALEQENKRLTDLLNSKSPSLKVELDKSKAEYEKQIASLKGEYEKQINTLKAEYATTIAGLNKEVETANGDSERKAISILAQIGIPIDELPKVKRESPQDRFTFSRS